MSHAGAAIFFLPESGIILTFENPPDTLGYSAKNAEIPAYLGVFSLLLAIFLVQD
jgi:hypothetical protein